MGEYIKSNLSYLCTRDITANNVENSPEGIILLSRIPRANHPVSEAELHARPGYSLGREDSMHGVQFADLVIPRRPGISTVQPIAIKPVMCPQGVLFANTRWRVILTNKANSWLSGL